MRLSEIFGHTHLAQCIEEEKRAVRIIRSGNATMRDALNKRHRDERELGHHRLIIADEAIREGRLTVTKSHNNYSAMNARNTTKRFEQKLNENFTNVSDGACMRMHKKKIAPRVLVAQNRKQAENAEHDDEIRGHFGDS
jgi:hypothetical protein